MNGTKEWKSNYVMMVNSDKTNIPIFGMFVEMQWKIHFYSWRQTKVKVRISGTARMEDGR